MKGPTYDHERVSFNLARLKKGGETFELVVDPDAAIRLKESGSGTVKDVVKAEKIFSDMKKGLLASEDTMKAVFGTTNFQEVAERILAKGEIQLTTEHRDKVREQKLRKLIVRIHREAIDPKTRLPHPEKRIELAFEEAKIKVNELKTVEQQFGEVVKKLQTILPLRFEVATIIVKIPNQYAGKVRGEVTKMAKVVKENWLPEHWEATLELPAGMKVDLVELLNDRTHGGAIIEEQEKKR